MTSKINRLGILLYMLFFSWLSNANINNHRYVNITQYDIYEGLAGNKVTQIAQDEMGYMWFGTHSGLSRFDSQNFENFKQDTLASNTLPANEISLFHWVKDEMWISLNDVGLARFNSTENAFSMVEESPGEPHGIEHSVVFAITSDAEDNVWVFQFDHGISVFEKSTQQFTHYTPENSDWLTSVRFFDAKKTVDNELWVATLEGRLLKIDPIKRTAKEYLIEYPIDDEKAGRMYAIAIGQNNQIYASGYQGVYQLNTVTDQFDLIVSAQNIIDLMGERLTVRSITSDADGNLWLATRGALLLLKEYQLTQVKFLNKGKPELSNFNIRMVYEDIEHNIWLATNNNGVLKLNQGWDQFNIYLPYLNPELPNNQIHLVLSDHGNLEDTFWIANQGERNLVVFRYQKGNFMQSQYYDESHHLPEVVLAMFQDSDYRLWITADTGFYVFDRSSNQFKLIDSPLIQGGVTQLFEVGAELYFGVYGEQQLYSVNKYNLTVTKHEKKMLNEIIISYVKDQSGDIWLVGNRGLEKFAVDNLELTVKIESDEGFNDIFFNQDDNSFWLISNGKVLHYQNSEGELVGQDTRLINAQISKDFVDSVKVFDNALWLGSSNGLIVTDISSGQITERITVEQNLPSNSVVGIIELYDQSKILFTDTGMAHIKSLLKDRKPNELPANILLGSIMLNESLLSNHTELEYNYGSLSLSYQLLSFSEPSNHQYQYKLFKDSNWINANKQNNQTFYQLSPGSYHFEVRGKSGSFDWSEPVSYDFVVKMPPWKSSMAYILYALTALLLLVLMFYLYRKRWQYQSTINQANEKQAFAETQLSLTTSLVSALATDELLLKIKQEIKNKIKADQIEVSYWNSQNNYQIFSDTSLDKVQQNELGAKALQLYELKQNHQVEALPTGTNLWVLFSHSANRLGLVRLFRQHGSFSPSDISLAKAYATQSALALENARLFEEVNHLAEQANASNKAKSDFLAQVSHEVRTPMNGILGMNELLLDTELTEEQRVYASAVAESGEHLLHIINDILDLSKIEAGELVLEARPVNLLALLDEVIKAFGSISKNKKLLFWTSFSKKLEPLRMADSVRLKQILMNLLSNAFKFTATGEVSVEINATTETNVVKISVKDSGIGIEADMLDKLFEPFTQADSSITRKYGGTGLGLSIVKQLTEKMGGAIEIQSEPNQGTEVSCYIPLALTGLSYEIKQKSKLVRLVGRHKKIKQGLRNCLYFNGIKSVKETGPISDALFIIDDTNIDYSSDIAEANRNLIPVYLLKPAHNHSRQLGTFKSLDLPFTYAGINQLFSNKSAEMYGESKPTKHHKKLHLLVVEDNPINQQLLLELLEKEGHMVDIFDDANHALAGVEKNSYDLLLVDYHLPDLTGIEFIDACRALNITTKTVIMTADISNELKQLCESSAVDYMITKPFKMAELTQIINAN